MGLRDAQRCPDLSVYTGDVPQRGRGGRPAGVPGVSRASRHCAACAFFVGLQAVASGSYRMSVTEGEGLALCFKTLKKWGREPWERRGRRLRIRVYPALHTCVSPELGKLWVYSDSCSLRPPPAAATAASLRLLTWHHSQSLTLPFLVSSIPSFSLFLFFPALLDRQDPRQA